MFCELLILDGAACWIGHSEMCPKNNARLSSPSISHDPSRRVIYAARSLGRLGCAAWLASSLFPLGGTFLHPLRSSDIIIIFIGALPIC